MSVKDMEAKIRKMRELQRMQEELDAEITALQDVIKTEMSTLGTDELLAGEYRVTWKPVASQRVDVTALKKVLPDIAAQFTKTTETRRFVVK